MGELKVNDDAVVAAIKRSVATETIVVDEETFVTRQVYTPPPEPTMEPLVIHTLSGLVQYLTDNADNLDGAYVHVNGPTQVDVVLPPAGRYKTRDYALRSEVYGISVRLNQYMSLEEAIIQLQCCFVANDMRAALLGVLGNVTSEVIGKWGDDGITQTVTAKKGLSLSETVQVPNPIPLAPFRTFPEIQQPESLFVVRLRQTDKAPQVALFEADGGAWRNDATASIIAYLTASLSEFEGSIIA